MSNQHMPSETISAGLACHRDLGQKAAAARRWAQSPTRADQMRAPRDATLGYVVGHFFFRWPVSALVDSLGTSACLPAGNGRRKACPARRVEWARDTAKPQQGFWGALPW